PRPGAPRGPGAAPPARGPRRRPRRGVSRRPGGRLGIGYRQLQPLNPRLVYVALSTHGQFGPRAPQAGPEYDLIDQALSGLAFLTGEPGDDPPPEVGGDARRPEAAPDPAPAERAPAATN